jgi:hypothetical protein
LGWFLFLLAVAGGVAFAIWNFHRKTAPRKAASEARFEKIFKGPAQIPASPPPPAAAQCFLGQAESLLYYLLKAGLPDSEVFAGVSLARVVGAAGEGREQQLRRLAQYQLDFVVCDKNMQVVAVVEVESAAGADAAGDRRFKSDLLKQAGIRLIRINPAALPQREQIRTLIDGGSPQ